MNPQDVNAQSIVSNQPTVDAGNAIVYSSQAFTAEYFKSPEEGVLTLYSNGQLQFVCANNSRKNVSFGLSDIKLANFAFGGSGSAIFTLNNGTKCNYTFGDFLEAGAIGTVGSVAGHAIGGVVGVGIRGGGAAVETQAVGASIQGSQDWQNVLEKYLPPEKIKKGSTKKYLLWVGGFVVIVMAIIVLIVSLLGRGAAP